ncbi:type IV pilin [Halorhabdus sp. CUG00001]|uniref:type IV pilin n=1 Tax=Halorhabdus sp. CUG00001 TaxID=2600297 RepID=UPI00131BD277|nr:type IV pilin N-terminal domain-containing protein [Halorhabdus sp. CUG00001]
MPTGGAWTVFSGDTDESASRDDSPPSRRPDETGSDRGMTPVVANVLLVAIAIVLGVTVTIFALGLAEPFEAEPPTASFETDYTAANGLFVRHQHGDGIDADRLSVRLDGRSYPVSAFVDDQRLTAGTQIGPLYPAASREAHLVWEQGDTSSIVYTATPPREGTVPAYLRFDERSLRSYGGGQDADAEFTSTTGARAVTLENNTWKLLDFEYNVTAQTVLEFDFRATNAGEIHGIGFETDDSISSDRIFKLLGSQPWGIEYGEYETGDGWVHYEIPVGVLYGSSLHGQTSSLALVNDVDNDTKRPSDSQFRNIRAYESPPEDSSIQFEFSADGATVTEPVQSYGSQDKDFGVAVSDDNAMLTLSENTWAYVPIDESVTDDTVLAVEFNASSQGEIHGVGLETDNSETESRFVRFNGTQSWATKVTPVSSGDDGWERYEIDVTSLLASSGETVSRLVFVNDDDTGGNGVSQFRNVTIYDE